MESTLRRRLTQRELCTVLLLTREQLICFVFAATDPLASLRHPPHPNYSPEGFVSQRKLKLLAPETRSLKHFAPLEETYNPT